MAGRLVLRHSGLCCIPFPREIARHRAASPLRSSNVSSFPGRVRTRGSRFHLTPSCHGERAFGCWAAGGACSKWLATRVRVRERPQIRVPGKVRTYVYVSFVCQSCVMRWAWSMTDCGCGTFADDVRYAFLHAYM